jgi:nucleotide-binding universal stress UspA family protein
MLKALVAVDGSQTALCAVRHVIKLIRDREPLEVHVVNVQPPTRGDVTMFVSASIVQDYHVDEANKALDPACKLLDEAGIPHRRHIFVGHAGEMIAECARRLHCDKVILGTHSRGPVTHFLLGSVTREVIHQLDPAIAITLIKAGYTAAA